MKKIFDAQFLKELLLQILATSGNKIGGLKGWLIAKALSWGGQAIADLISDLWRKVSRSAEQEKAKQEKDKIVEKPDATADEVGKAYEDYYNSGRNNQP